MMTDEPRRQNVTPERPRSWDWRQDKAAELLALGTQTDEAIAAEVTVSRMQLFRWRQLPYFAAEVERHRAEQRAAVLEEGIASRLERVRSQNDRWRRMLEVIAARAADTTMTGPGHATGLLTRTYRQSKTRITEEYSVDTALLKELRELEKHAATELGQWTEHKSVSGDLTIQTITEIVVALPPEDAE